MKKISLTFILIILLILPDRFVHAQSFIQWQKSYGGTSTEYGYAIDTTNDGGYIVAGSSFSNDGDVTGNHGNADYWIVKLGSTGDIQWQKSLGGTGTENPYSIEQTTDGGYIVAGSSTSNNGDVTGNHGSTDYWVVKLKSTGTIQWQKSLGGSGAEKAYSIQQTADDGYIVAGYSESNEGDVSGNHGNSDIWVVKLDSTGSLKWQKSLGGSGSDDAFSIQQTNDRGYIVAGWSSTNDGQVTGNHGSLDYWVVKLDSTGILLWQKSLGGTSIDEAYAIQQSDDGGYIVAGSSQSNNGDVTGNHGHEDYWVIKLDSSGTLKWQKSLGGSYIDQAYSIKKTADKGCIVAGTTWLNTGVTISDGDVTGNHGWQDYWVVKLDSTGTLQWQKCYGGSYGDNANSMQLTGDGGCIVVGSTNSNDGDVTAGYGNGDFWVVKLSDVSGIKESNSSPSILSIYPNPTYREITIQTPQTSTIEIFNLEGQILKTLPNAPPTTTIDVSGLPAGIWFIKATTEKGTEVRKFIRE